MADMSSLPSSPSADAPSGAALLAVPQAWEPSTVYKDDVGTRLAAIINTPDGDSTDTQRYLYVLRTLQGLRDVYNHNRRSGLTPEQAATVTPRRLDFSPRRLDF